MLNIILYSYLFIACDGKEIIDEDGDGYVGLEDCNDQDTSIHSEAEDSTGDGVDQNCDGLDGIDKDLDGLASIASGGTDCNDEDSDLLVSTAQYVYLDEDGDGFGGSELSILCDVTVDYVGNSADCDDQNEEIHPEATEVCDGLDNDCDSLLDDLDDSLSGGIWAYLDQDGDGFGNSAEVNQFCLLEEGWTLDPTDCDDQDGDLGSVDTDEDCDGFLQTWDCNDQDAENSCQSPAVETLAGRWHCSEEGDPNLPNFEHIGGNFFHLVFDWSDDGWCRKLGLIEITQTTSSTDFEWVLYHEAPAEEEDFHWHTYPNMSSSGEFHWEQNLMTLSTWNDTFPESFALSCERCGAFDEETTCAVPDPPYPIEYDYPVPDDYICKPVNFTNID